MALKRLKTLKRKFEREPELKERYTEQMEVMIRKDYAEVIDDTDLACRSRKIWYIPHHSVLNPNKPNKL